MRTYEVGDPVEVLTISRRYVQPDWVPATVYFATDDAVEVQFTDLTKQRFFVTSDRLRKPGAAVEGAQWVF